MGKYIECNLAQKLVNIESYFAFVGRAVACAPSSPFGTFSRWKKREKAIIILGLLLPLPAGEGGRQAG